MSRILDLAEAVAAALADYSAEVLFIPECDLKGTKETRVIVVPAGTEFKALSRASHEERPASTSACCGAPRRTTCLPSWNSRRRWGGRSSTEGWLA